MGTSYTTARARVARIAMADRAGLGVLDRCWINQQVFQKANSAQTLYLLKN
ncbi:MAG: hypothetical protein DSM106950_29770 [Stigonema ocellatum SAG 48.90 = DSM 106950]|nr:hypothetical protein [Stigonema ocellatum SAG 48.90 = DSM 106950]